MDMSGYRCCLDVIKCLYVMCVYGTVLLVHIVMVIVCKYKYRYDISNILFHV